MVGVGSISTWVPSGMLSVSRSISCTSKFWSSNMEIKLAMLSEVSISPWPVAMVNTGTSSMFTSSRAPARALSTME